MKFKSNLLKILILIFLVCPIKLMADPFKINISFPEGSVEFNTKKAVESTLVTSLSKFPAYFKLSKKGSLLKTLIIEKEKGFSLHCKTTTKGPKISVFQKGKKSEILLLSKLLAVKVAEALISLKGIQVPKTVRQKILGTAPKSYEKLNILVLNFAGEGLELKQREMLKKTLTTALVNLKKISIKDQYFLNNQILDDGDSKGNCNGLSCQIEIAGAMGIDEAITGDISNEKDNLMVSFLRIKLEDNSILSTQNLIFKKPKMNFLMEQVKIAAVKLFPEYAPEKNKDSKTDKINPWKRNFKFLSVFNPKNRPACQKNIKNDCEKKCQKGQKISCRNLGYQYLFGKTKKKDLKVSKKYYQKACSQGDGRSCFQIAFIYKNYLINQENQEKINHFYNKACIKKFPLACALLGLSYEYDRYGSGKNIRLAHKYYKLGCKGGNARSCTNLGYFYENGISTTRNKKEAKNLYEVACIWGNARACNNLAGFYEYGEAVKKDIFHSKKLYKMGCFQGSSQSCFNLGELILSGKLKSKNSGLAKNYFKKACDQGLTKACLIVNKINE